MKDSLQLSYTQKTHSLSPSVWNPNDWNRIDTVLLDMDGTLLDLHFDNYFWLNHLPKRYAEIHAVDIAAARAKLTENISQHEGTLQWYCLEFWSEQFQVDIRALKEEVKHLIQMRPQAAEFLAQLRKAHKKIILVTNAHQQSLSLKLSVTHLDQWMDVVISSHELNHPKEAQAFWHSLQARHPFDPARTLFIDDTARILKSAQDYGIKFLLGIHQPDSQQKRLLSEFPAIHHFDEIMPQHAAHFGNHKPFVGTKVRLDKWLWAARFFKTRTLAKQAIEGGKIQCDGNSVKAAKEITQGVTLRIRQGLEEKIVVVLALNDQRRAAPEAALLYQETEESILLREKRAAERKAGLGSFIASDHKPTKKERRHIHQFKRINFSSED